VNKLIAPRYWYLFYRCCSYEIQWYTSSSCTNSTTAWPLKHAGNIKHVIKCYKTR